MSNSKAKGKKIAFLLLVVLLLAMLASYVLAQEDAPGVIAGRVRHSSVTKSSHTGIEKGMFESWRAMREGTAPGSSRREHNHLGTPPIRLPLSTTDFETQSLTGATACANLIANSQLDILEFGDGYGSAEPWIFFIPEVYYVHESFSDIGAWAFDGYSLILEDGDSDDPSPNFDMFGQGFLMPDNLSELTVEYWRMSVDGNDDDIVWGELWLLDDKGSLILNDPDQYFIAYWDVYESELIWEPEIITSNENIMNDLEGRWAALILYNDTDGSLPSAPEAEKEWMLFDDITLTACYKTTPVSGKRVYLPSIQKAGEVKPYCMPPSENPRDEYHSNRGYTQTGASCKSTLSNVDKADYYSYIPNKDGSHTLQLKNLPQNTEWSAMIFVDSASPTYAPGDTSGQCRIDKPGSENKEVKCDLKKNKEYFIKVSAGSTPKAGSYEMKVVTP